jgi:hypothetical protein
LGTDFAPLFCSADAEQYIEGLTDEGSMLATRIAAPTDPYGTYIQSVTLM